MRMGPKPSVVRTMLRVAHPGSPVQTRESAFDRRDQARTYAFRSRTNCFDAFSRTMLPFFSRFLSFDSCMPRFDPHIDEKLLRRRLQCAHSGCAEMHASDAKGSARDELQTEAMLHVCHLASRLQVQCTVFVACVSQKSLRSRGFVIMRTLFAIQITRNLEMKNPDLGAGGVTTASRPT